MMSSEFEFGVWLMAMMAAGVFLKVDFKPYVSAPSSTVATSFKRTIPPFSFVAMIIFSKSSTLLKRPFAVKDNVIKLVFGEGADPIEPTEACTFCVLTALMTSFEFNFKAVNFSGLSQMRMAYWGPKIVTSPTPLTRASGFLRFS